MLKYKLFTVLVFFNIIFGGCSGKEHAADGFTELKKGFKVEKTGNLDEVVSESSGLALAQNNTFWTHNDAGNGSQLFHVNMQGKLQEIVEIDGAINKDWEDLAKDKNGNLYIGDFGNNSNKRKSLRIYKISEQNMMLTDTITFTYPDQKEFPPPKPARNFDCEAFLWHDNNLYLFTKNRGESKYTKLYKLPDSGGTHTAQLLDSIETNSMITSADISPNSKQFALLGNDLLYLIEMQNNEIGFKGKKNYIPYAKSGQAEAIGYLNESELIFTNEDGKIFHVTLDQGKVQAK